MLNIIRKFYAEHYLPNNHSLKIKRFRVTDQSTHYWWRHDFGGVKNQFIQVHDIYISMESFLKTAKYLQKDYILRTNTFLVVIVIAVILFLKKAFSEWKYKNYKKVKIRMTNVIYQNKESNTRGKKTINKLQH